MGVRILRRSASPIAIFIKAPAVGRTYSIGIALQCSVGQIMRILTNNSNWTVGMCFRTAKPG
jgi:hypothetical protein